MTNKEIPYWKPVIDLDDYKELNNIFKNNYVNQGPISNNFENKIKKIFNTKYSITTNNSLQQFILLLNLLI